jgi:hypothetical protein
MNRSKQAGMPIKSIIILLVGLALASVRFAEAQQPNAFSGPKQPPNPEQKSHPIRRNPASVPEQNSHRPFVGLG